MGAGTTRTRTLDFGLRGYQRSEISSSQLKSLNSDMNGPSRSCAPPSLLPPCAASIMFLGGPRLMKTPVNAVAGTGHIPCSYSLPFPPFLGLPPSSSLSQTERDRETERQRDRERARKRERERKLELTRRQDRKSVNREAGKHLYPSRTETQSCTLHKFVSGAPVMWRMLSGPVLESFGFEF